RSSRSLRAEGVEIAGRLGHQCEVTRDPAVAVERGAHDEDVRPSVAVDSGIALDEAARAVDRAGADEVAIGLRTAVLEELPQRTATVHELETQSVQGRTDVDRVVGERRDGRVDVAAVERL